MLVAARSMYDAVVVDTGPLFDGAMLAALDHTDELLLVCNPEVTSLKNVRIGLETIDRLGFERERISLVANRLGAPGALDGRRSRARSTPRSRTSCRTILQFPPRSTGRPGRRLEREVPVLARTRAA